MGWVEKVVGTTWQVYVAYDGQNVETFETTVNPQTWLEGLFIGSRFSNNNTYPPFPISEFLISSKAPVFTADPILARVSVDGDSFK